MDANQSTQGMCHAGKRTFFKGNENYRRAITAHPVVPRAKFAQAGIEPHGIESRTSLEFQKSQGIK
ncbi:MAG: hypothetical protein ABSH11_08705 [Verrucomicrobiota bacterium]|jgi:hypothetical protein